MYKELTSEQIARTLRYSIVDGTSYAVMLGMGESFLVAFAIFLNAGPIEIALIASLPLFLGSLSQLGAKSLLRICGTRQTNVILGAFFQGVLYIPILLTFFMGEHKVLWLILCICLYRIGGMVIGPAWNSWMSDVVPAVSRGEYFARRSRIMEFATFVGLIVAGAILKFFSKSLGNDYQGFCAIFVCAFLARMLCCVFLMRHYEPANQGTERPKIGFRRFLRDEKYKEYRTIVFYLSCMNMTVYLSAPFFTPYMLNVLKLNYFSFTVVIASAVVAKILSMKAWGRAIDQFGARRVLLLAGLLMPLSPILWFFSAQFWYLIVIQIYAGFVWAGFEICAFNISLESTQSEERLECISYYNVINGILLFCGSILGAISIHYINNVEMYLGIFFISGAFRYLVSFLYIPRLQAWKVGESISYGKLFCSVLSQMPTLALVYAIVPSKKKMK